MCGIAGVYQLKKIETRGWRRAVERMSQHQINRGPDDKGINLITNNSITVILGNRRLSIQDLSKVGHQPMKMGKLWITFNGEIYNFQELREELKKKKYKFKTETDTEVILALYDAYGTGSFSKLRGMFAFALWDDKKKKLFLVKDRYGIKPLYYYADDKKLIFASTVKAIVKSGLAVKEENPKALIGFLLFGSVPLPMTTVKNIVAVPAGHYFECDNRGHQKLVKYYEPLKFYREVNSYSITNNPITIIQNIRRLLEESVKLHLISDAPLGVFLSGGLDSSAIAALARHSLGKGGLPLATLSIIFDEPEFSEQKYQQLVVQKVKSDHREVKITSKDFFDSFDDIFEAMDQPTIDGVNTYFVAKAAKEAGLKTVLSGLGGDEIFLGYSYFRRASFLRTIQRLPSFLRAPLGAAFVLGDRYAKMRYFANDDILSFYLGLRGLFSPEETAEILDVDLSEVNNFINEFNNSITNNSITNNLITDLHPVDLLSFLEIKFYLQNQLLKDTDFMAMRHSIEVRVPFLDHPLVEYLSGLPPEVKVNGYLVNKLLSSASNNLITNNLITKTNKPLLVAAVHDLLPQEIFNRPKMGFTFPFQKWLGQKKVHWSRFWAKEVLSKFK